MNYNIIILTDDKTILRQAVTFCAAQGVAVERAIYCNPKKVQIEHGVSEVYCSGKSEILLVMKNGLLQAYTKELHLAGVESLYVYAYDIQLESDGNIPTPEQWIHIDNKKPRLSFLDVEISEHCNLKCKGCLDFSNLVREKKFLDLELFKSNLLKLKEYVWGVATIHLQGGEPLTNPDFPEYAKITHEVFPDCDVHMVTNGLLVATVDIEKLRELKSYNCTLNITQYPIVRHTIKKIKRRLNEASVNYVITLPRYLFAKKILSTPHKHPEIAFKHCLIKRCSGMQENFISPCMFPLHIYKFNNAFGYELPDSDKMDIYNMTVDGWKLVEILEDTPIAFCSYCHYGIVPFFWKQQKVAEVRAEDWIVKSNVVNSKVLPLVYRMAGSVFFKAYKMFSGSEGKINK